MAKSKSRGEKMGALEKGRLKRKAGGFGLPAAALAVIDNGTRGEILAQLLGYLRENDRKRGKS